MTTCVPLPLTSRSKTLPDSHSFNRTREPQPVYPPAEIAKAAAEHGIHIDAAGLAKLEKYDALLLKWQKAINLVGVATLEDRAHRHFLDSIQLLRYLPSTDVKLVDIGSGGGFPGLVLAMLGVREVHLVESDIRKATFLREVSRETSLPVTIHDQRVEACQIDGMQVMTARALAPLVDLLGYMHRLSDGRSDTMGLFMKGAQAETEIAKAQKRWVFSFDSFPSLTEPEARVLRITALEPKGRH